MSIQRRITQIGGSLGVTIPRDVAELMGVVGGSEVNMSLVGRQLVLEPTDDTIPEASFRRSLARVLRTHGPAFAEMAARDAGKVTAKRRHRR